MSSETVTFVHAGSPVVVHNAAFWGSLLLGEALTILQEQSLFQPDERSVLVLGANAVVRPALYYPTHLVAP
jgi:hypothetical protein